MQSESESRSWMTRLADVVMWLVYAGAIVLAVYRTAALQVRYVPVGEEWLAWVGALSVEGLFVALTFYLLDKVRDSELQKAVAAIGIAVSVAVSGASQVLESALLSGAALGANEDLALRIVIPLVPTICMVILAGFKIAGAQRGQRATAAPGVATQNRAPVRRAYVPSTEPEREPEPNGTGAPPGK